MNIEEGNKIITDFMGYTIEDKSDDKLKWFSGRCWSPFREDGWGCASQNRDWVESQMYWGKDFHKDWRWLMPVIEKIEKQGTIIQLSFSGITNCKITVGNFKEPIITVANTESQDSMEAIYLAVIDYIKWYNDKNL